ncbi:hypothetical protein ACVWXO_005623 [Bradyrhizobium sp. LM2.7]
MAVNDGFANAPVGTPQLSSLLDSYGANRPGWNVAGVDYYVGAPQGLALKNPAMISMAGVSVDTTNHIVTVTGSNVTLDGYDFSLNGGWQVSVQGANTKIANSDFVVGSNDLIPIVGAQTASNLSVVNCTIDGAGHDPGPWGTLIGYRGNGLTVEYSSLKNSGGDMIQQIDGGAGSTITIEHNLIQDGGLSSGAHGDYTQLAGGPFTLQINYNTTVQNGGSTQGLMTEYVSQGQIANNTMVGDASYFTSVDLSSLTGTMTVRDNYYDPKGFGFVYPNSGPDDSSSLSVFVHNVNMTNGAVLQDSNAPTSTTTSGSSGSTMTSGSAAPVIASFSTDSGVAGDMVTNDNALDLKGTAAAGSTVKIYDGSTQIGTATATSTGSWDYISQVLTDAKHTLTATATNASGQTSAASAALTVTVDTQAPTAPTIVSETVNSANQVVASGTAEANSAIKVYDGTTQVGTATTNSSGAWSVTTSALSAGSHALTAKATDVAGNVSAASTAVDPVIGSGTSGSTGSGTSGTVTSGTGTSGTGTSGTGASAPAAPKIGSFSTDSGVAGDHITSDKTLTLAGSADANSTVKVFDGATQLGIVTADANGAWHYATAARCPTASTA